ncbi:cyclic nucleotide-binding domain-containing protein [Chitinophaga sp. SYP-B3965]|uniref:Crp/Fnr family transcriptional regulator n=1 Tax=Chitinophaga sp. SYP-B3965 TaxID=2663120 RepID=UPI0012999BE4|nr:Crp/Fnr family transcriptional regulator [Chitinophaga sp. SYP-B3965]MRG48824.1 cyclic nucleotide-binding domain-containing protein [Chitinophaga sp. SYP-B3965]
MISVLVDHIRRYVSLDEREVALLAEYIEVVDVKKKAFLLKEGEVCKANYFVIKGCCRSYFTTEKDTEHVHLFAIENWWITDYGSLERKTPSMYYIQTLEPCTLGVLNRDKQDELFAAIPQLERYFRCVLETALAAAHMRIKYIYSQTGHERYNHFSTLFPEFVQRIPQYMLASYLGFTPEFLSKIRAGKIS